MGSNSAMDRSQLSRLPQVSTDTVSRIRWSPQQSKEGKDQNVLSSSWDCSLRFYDANVCATKALIKRQRPILDCAFYGPSRAVAGDLDGVLSCYDLETQTETFAATNAHESSIRCVEVLQRQNRIYTGSWDKQVKVWDTNSKKPAASVKVGSKVFCMDASSKHVVVGCSDKTISVYDVRKFDAPILARELLKFQLRSLKCFPDQSGFVCASVEGRVAWEYYDPGNSSRNFIFKCHRVKENKIEAIYPVHALAFMNKHHFVTGGGDGCVNMWDSTTKKKLGRTPKFETAVTSLDVSPDGSKLAIAISSPFEEHDKSRTDEWHRPNIYIYTLRT